MRRLSVSARCALTSLVVVLVLGAVLAAAVQRVVLHQATAEATRSGEVVATFISRGMAPSAFDRLALTPDEREVLDGVVAGSTELRGLRLWGRGGRVLYASDALPGAPVRPVDPLLDRAYAGQVASQVTSLGDRSVLQVLVPIAAPEGRRSPGVVEVALRHSASAERSADAVAALGALLAGGLAVLWALLWWLSRFVTRALRRTAVEQEELARTDSLTGLPNRRALLSALEAALDPARPRPLALLLLDLDRFKDVNDTLGHAVGDRLLSEVGARLRGRLREQDLVARLGGDEFAVLLPGVLDPAEAVATARRLTEALQQPFELDGLLLDVQGSIGIALAPRQARDASELLQRADVAMYVAKSRSTSCAVYDEDQDRNSTDRLLLLADLKEGLARGELSLVYQPCYDLQVDGRVHAVEALVRWHSPKRGFVSPAEFVPVCERSGLVRELTSFVLGEALRQLRAWEDAGTRINVAVNLSASNLTEDDLPEMIGELLARHGVGADRVVLEITESAVIPDPARAARILGRLVELGLDIAIDDFGTGWSSMSRLLELPLAALKVDQSFVADLPHGPGAAVVAATTRLAHDLGLFVVVEGIETEEQLAHAVSLGCDVGQGYLLSRPLTPEAVPQAVAGAPRPGLRVPA